MAQRTRILSTPATALMRSAMQPLYPLCSTGWYISVSIVQLHCSTFALMRSLQTWPSSSVDMSGNFRKKIRRSTDSSPLTTATLCTRGPPIAIAWNTLHRTNLLAPRTTRTQITRTHSVSQRRMCNGRLRISRTHDPKFLWNDLSRTTYLT